MYRTSCSIVLHREPHPARDLGSVSICNIRLATRATSYGSGRLYAHIALLTRLYVL